MKNKIISILILVVSVLGCSSPAADPPKVVAKSPRLLPVIEAPVPESSRALIPDFNNPNKEMDFFIPAITSFKKNSEGVSVDDAYNAKWGNVDLVFTISEQDGVFTYVASKDDDYVFELVFDENKSTFQYYHEINIDERSTDSAQSDLIIKTVISETAVNSAGEFRGMARMAGYAIGGAGSWAETPGMFLLYDNIEIYNGLIQAVQSQDLVIDTTEQNGCGFACYKSYVLKASEVYSLNLSNSKLLNILDGMIGDPDSFKNNNSTNSMIQASIAVKLDDNTSFFETDADWEEHEHHLWKTQCPVFSTFKALIPWDSDLSEN